MNRKILVLVSHFNFERCLSNSQISDFSDMTEFVEVWEVEGNEESVELETEINGRYIELLNSGASQAKPELVLISPGVRHTSFTPVNQVQI